MRRTGLPGSAASVLLSGWAAFSSACAGAAPEAAAPANSPGSTASSSPGVAVDPAFELPKAGLSGDATAGLVVLRAPPGPAPIQATVSAFFDAVTAESTTLLEQVVDASARSLTSSKSGSSPALPWWRRRFDVLDYGTLGSELFLFPSSFQIFTSRDHSSTTASQSLPRLPRGEEVVVRVPLEGCGTARLLGPEIVFLLKPDSSKPNAYKIAELYEDFRLP
jgi:hypothetical protein